MGANDDIADALIRHQIGLQRLSQSVLRRVVAELRKADARIIARLSREDQPGRRRQEALIRDIRAVLAGVYTDAFGKLDIELEALAQYEAKHHAGLVRRAVTVQGADKVPFTLPSADGLRAAVYSQPMQGKFLREWYSELSTATQRAVRNTIREGYLEGRSTARIVRDLRGTRAQGYRDGVLSVGRRQAETVVRTAINHTGNRARQHFYDRNADKFKGLEWAAVLDSRTSAICRARDGKIYPVDSGPRPPAHPNCRSVMLPIVKSARELGVSNPKLDGQRPQEATYGAWLKRQNVATQNEVLGVSKAKLFRKGELEIDRFVDRSGNELTLGQLKEREADAWQKAGLG